MMIGFNQSPLQFFFPERESQFDHVSNLARTTVQSWSSSEHSISEITLFLHCWYTTTFFFMNDLQNLSPFFCLTTENNGYHSIFVKYALRKSSKLLFCFDLNNTSISWISFPFLIFISTSTFFLFYLGTLAFGNSVYLLLNVGFIQMLKSFTPVIIMVTAYLTRIENPSR